MVTNQNISPSDSQPPEGFLSQSRSDLKAHVLLNLENEILDALNSPNPRFELAQIAQWNRVPIDVIEQTAQSISKQLLGRDLERVEFDSVVRTIQKLELEEPDIGFREWKLQGIARRLKRTPRQLMDAYNKALCQQKAVQPMTVKEFRERQNQDVAWLVQGWIPRGSTLLLHADGGVGKTLFAYELMESIVSGKPWNGYQVQQGSALLVQVDEPELVTAERIDIRGIADDAPLGILSEWQVEQMANLENTIAKEQPSLVIVDSLTAINRGCIFSENDTEYARPILQLAAIASKHHCTVIIIHHSNAEGNSRGTRAIHNSVSEVWGLTVAEGSDRLLRVQKTRLGRPPGRYRFKFDEDDFSFHYVGEDGNDDSDASATQEERVRLWLGEQQGTRYSVAEVCEYLNMSKNTARKACYELWAKGLIKRAKNKGDRNYSYYIGSKPCDSECDRSDQVISVDSRNITSSDPTLAQTEPAIEGQVIKRSTKNAFFDGGTPVNFCPNDRSLDHLPLNAKPDMAQDEITSSDLTSDLKQEVITLRSSEALQAGDIVTVNATATWYRSGSDKLPYRELRPSDKQAAAIPINTVTTTLLAELIAPSKVLEISRSGDRVKVRNQQTARTSVFGINDVQVLRQGDRKNG